MLPAAVESALVVIVAFLLKLACDWLNIPLDEAVLTSIAIAIVAFLLGRPAGARVHNALFNRG